MTLGEEVAAVFNTPGVLGAATEEFRAREGQTQLALAVARVVEQGGELVAEAATGVGKTFAYLVPTLLSGERALISTATKTLQDQLFARDLPRLVQALGVPVRLALLKGRASYLCLHRMELARQEWLEPAQQRTLARVERWAQGTRTGDLAEMTGLDERSALIPRITSTRENCLGADCPKFRACHVNLARREAMAADVVVINHHLFFADLAIRESGMAELLPSVRVVVFDEAHQLNEIGIQFLGQAVSTHQVADLSRDVLGAGLQQARGLADWQGVASGLEHAARNLRLAFGRVQGSARLRWIDDAPEGMDPTDWREALSPLDAALTAAADALDTVTELSPDFGRLLERVKSLAARLERFARPAAPDCVRWVDLSAQARLVESPLDIADTVRGRLLDAPRDTEQADAPVRRRAWVFVSATLGDDAQLSWFTEPCGLQHAEHLRIGSPFDYGRQAALYVPPHLPRPNDPSHATALARLAGDGAARLGGRTLVLTTTLRALRSVGDQLTERFAGQRDIEVLVQGQWPKRVLMDRFRAAGQDGAPGCVLVASASFWEGFDAPGDALQLVVIDKLPFPPPGDPLVEARCRRLEAQGRRAFAHYSVPEAAVALKQGAGRLIRRETDTGVLVIGDTRLTGMSYGRRLLAALPPMRRLMNDDEFRAALDALEKGAETTDAVS